MVVVSKDFSIPALSLAAFALLAGVISRDALATDLIYLNRCTGNCMVTEGVDDAVNHVSSIISGTRNLLEFPYGDGGLPSPGIRAL
jgi:hypothetical protein